MKRLRVVIALAILMAGCNLKVEEWNSNKILPLDASLPLIDSSYTLASFIEDNPTYLYTRQDSIFFGEDTTIVNQYFAVDSTINIFFSHGLPDVFDTLRTNIQSELHSVVGTMRLKGNVILPVTLYFGLTYFKDGIPIDGDTIRVSLPAGICDTVIRARLTDVPIGSFSVTLRGTGSVGAVNIDTLYMGYEIPAHINFRGDTLIFEEITIEIDSSTMKFAEKELIDTVEFHMRAGNHLPIGLEMTTWVLNKEKTDSSVVFNRSAIAPASLSSDGFAENEIQSTFHATASRQLFNYMKKDTMFLHLSIRVPSQSGTAKFRPEDYLRIGGYVRVKGYLDFEKLQEEE
jgi:hypothetical protein